MREAFAGRILVPEWPLDPAEFSTALLELRCFDTPAVSAEDRARATIYAAERERRTASESAASPDVWLETLQIDVTAESLSAVNLARAAQLFNKTNQMNLATRRLSENELKAWASAPNRRVWTFRVTDRFGDSGLTGILSVEIKGDTAQIADFVMSCRVMGRRVEEAMVHTAVEHARAEPGVKRVVAQLLPTERNRPCLEFWQRSGFEGREGNCFHWDPIRPYPRPDFIKLVKADLERPPPGEADEQALADSRVAAGGYAGRIER